ncbi:hypothetical protein PRK78_002359 [Emydomyces testavorans]|uniref:ERCC4 domain-containing protein n=1 Tax=Emydomyces testavorans TaxID=2070801 RepID=A0AAF0DG76_9EURO|nr:hypothetical protein PRK78_002359 [Emydomyces testavorans]
MAEVINLLSSPELCQRQPSKRPSTAQQGALRHNDSLLSDIFDDSLFDLEETSKPLKRQRLDSLLDISALPPRNHAPATNTVLSSILDDFSEAGENCGLKKNELRLLSSWNDAISDFGSFSPHGPDTQVAYREEGLMKSTNVITIDDDTCNLENDDLLQDPFDSFPPPASQSQYSDRTSSLLAKVRNQPQVCKDKAISKKADRTSIPLSDEDVPLPTVARPKARRPAQRTAPDRTAKALDREAAKLRREKEKEEEKERKRKLKEDKEKAKKMAADIVQANKLKVNKKESTPEMLVDIASSFEGTSVGNQAAEYMRRLGVQMSFIPTQIPNMISWRRQVTAFYNETAGHWEPCPRTIKTEEHVMCFLSAPDFANLTVASETGLKLEAHFQKIMQHYPGCKPIYLIEGLTAWMRKNQNVRNRAYQAAALRHFGDISNSTEEANPANRRSKRAPLPPPIDDDTIEDALLQLQVQHNCLIYHTATAAESAEWIKNFTEHISTIPYRQERINMQNAAFCMDTGQVKTGADVDDTYIKMLEEIQRVTAPIAYGVAMEYGSVRELVSGLDRHGPLRLQDVKKCANKSGALAEARIGPAVSKRLHRIFTSLDPASTDI